jgi:hypothetical protein
MYSAQGFVALVSALPDRAAYAVFEPTLYERAYGHSASVCGNAFLGLCQGLRKLFCTVPRWGDANPVPDVANIRSVRPPLVYVRSILLGLLLHFAWPLLLMRHPVGVLIGAFRNLSMIVEVKSPAQQKECQGVGKTSPSF